MWAHSGIFARDEADLRRELDVGFEWLWRHGHMANGEKLEFAALADHSRAPRTFDYVWLPSEAEAARRNGTKLKVATFQRKIRYLGYTFGDGSRGHARQQAAIVSDASKRVAARAYARVYLNVERGLWAWTMAARHHGEKFSAVWPRLDRDLSEYLEESQTRALVGILGEAAPPRTASLPAPEQMLRASRALAALLPPEALSWRVEQL